MLTEPERNALRCVPFAMLFDVVHKESIFKLIASEHTSGTP